MAIAPSKLGGLIAEAVGYRVDHSDATSLYNALKQRALLAPTVEQDDVATAMTNVRSEFNYADPFNSPNERLREHLRPFLNEKGLAWAEPLKSLELPDDEKPVGGLRSWWRRLIR